jgi:hypothetical protein
MTSLVIKKFLLLDSKRNSSLSSDITRGAYRVLVGKPGLEETVGRTRCRWVDGIKMYLQK